MVDDIELVIFESDELSELPETTLLSNLRQTALRENLTFTVHLPLDIWLGDSNEALRKKSVDKCLRVIERMRTLLPQGYILHCHKNAESDMASIKLESWQRAVGLSLDDILLSGTPAEMLSVETLDYPFNEIEPIVIEKKCGVCLDIGHILAHKFPLEEYLSRYSEKARIIHLHGVKAGRDHCDISAIPAETLSIILKHLNNGTTPRRIVSLEVFNPGALDASLEVFERTLS
jgi:sugar phosphate isomerase/epimerase